MSCRISHWAEYGRKSFDSNECRFESKSLEINIFNWIAWYLRRNCWNFHWPNAFHFEIFVIPWVNARLSGLDCVIACDVWQPMVLCRLQIQSCRIVFIFLCVPVPSCAWKYRYIVAKTPRVKVRVRIIEERNEIIISVVTSFICKISAELTYRNLPSFSSSPCRAQKTQKTKHMKNTKYCYFDVEFLYCALRVFFVFLLCRSWRRIRILISFR